MMISSKLELKENWNYLMIRVKLVKKGKVVKFNIKLWSKNLNDII